MRGTGTAQHPVPMSTDLVHRDDTNIATSAQLAWLRTQLDAWRSEGLLSDDQATAIWGRYRASRRFSVARLLLSLGGVFVGVGLIWLVAANLDQLSPLARFGLVVLIWLTLLGAGELLHQRAGTRRVPAALVFGLRVAAALAIGAVVFQAAQSLQVPAYEPKLVGLWAVAALLHAYAARSTAPLLVGLVAGVVWLPWQVGWSEPSVLGVVLSVLLASVIGLGAAAVHSTRLPHFAAPYRELGAALALGGLFVAALPFVTVSDFAWSGWLVVAAVAAILVAAAGVALAPGAQRLEPLAAAGVLVVAVLLVVWESGADAESVTLEDWLHALVSVGTYVVVAVGVAVLGTLRDSWRLTALATVGLVVFTTVQAFAVFARIIQGAWLFVVLGLVFLGTGYLFDRARRELASALEGEDR
jgi:uncharacterized membrane protein